MIEGAEERYLHEMLVALHEGYVKAAKPYIERLAAIHMMRPPTPVIITVEQAQALGLVPGNAFVSGLAREVDSHEHPEA